MSLMAEAGPVPGTYPKAPDAAFMTPLLKAKAGEVTLTLDPSPPPGASQDEGIIWQAVYSVNTPSGLVATATLVRSGKIHVKALEDLANHPEMEYQKITEPNGDVIYQCLANRSEQGTLYSTTLIHHAADWDLMLVLGIGPGVAAESVTPDIRREGIALIRRMNEHLRAE
jgi:hypothetical protein